MDTAMTILTQKPPELENLSQMPENTVFFRMTKMAGVLSGAGGFFGLGEGELAGGGFLVYGGEGEF